MSTPPPSAAPARAPQGADLVLRPVVPVAPGQVLAARVISAADGLVELALAGTRLTAATDLPMEPGAAVRLAVASAEADRVTLRLVPDHAAAPVEAEGAGARPPGMAAAAARAVLATLAELGVPVPPDAGARAPLLARAAAAGVQTPAQGAAFARLLAADLPVTPAAVRGLADLVEGPALGRVLALLAGDAPEADAALPPRAAPSPSPGAPGAPAAPAPPAGTAADSDAPAPRARAAAPSPAPVAPAAVPTTSAAPPAAAVPVRGEAQPAAAPPPSAATPLAALAALVEDLGAGAVSGDPERVRQAVALLGHGLEAALRHREVPSGDAVLRTMLLQTAQAPDLPPHLARAADRAADAVAAQSLAPPTLAANAAAADPSQQGAYLQMPLPGGQTAEVRVMPDGGGGSGGEGGERRTLRVAFLLHMSALGPVLVEATVGPRGVDATVRAQSPAVRAFLEGEAAELAAGLARVRPDGAPPRVGVDRLAPPPARLLPAPPPGGLDVSA